MEKKKPQIKANSIKRLLKLLLEAYPVMVPIVGVCIVIAAVTAALPAIFQQTIYVVIEKDLEKGMDYRKITVVCPEND